MEKIYYLEVDGKIYKDDNGFDISFLKSSLSTWMSMCEVIHGSIIKEWNTKDWYLPYNEKLIGLKFKFPNTNLEATIVSVMNRKDCRDDEVEVEYTSTNNEDKRSCLFYPYWFSNKDKITGQHISFYEIVNLEEYFNKYE